MTPAGYESAQFYQPVGCDACGGTGFTGRTVISELLLMTEDMRRLTMRRVSADEVRALAIEQGMVPIYADGVAKAAAASPRLTK